MCWTYGEDENDRARGDGGVAEEGSRGEGGAYKAKHGRNGDPTQDVSDLCADTKGAAYSKTLEYSSLRAANNWMTMRRQPRGKAMSESTKEPLKLTLQIDAEHMPPKTMICHVL